MPFECMTWEHKLVWSSADMFGREMKRVYRITHGGNYEHYHVYHFDYDENWKPKILLRCPYGNINIRVTHDEHVQK